jgi:hypothetical protein
MSVRVIGPGGATIIMIIVFGIYLYLYLYVCTIGFNTNCVWKDGKDRSHTSAETGNGWMVTDVLSFALP